MEVPARRALVIGLAVAALAGGRAEPAGRGAFDREAWRAEVVRRGLDPESVVYPFATTPELVAWARGAVPAERSVEPRLRLDALQRAIFDPDGLGFTYDEQRTVSAAEAFTTRSGNCLSFTALFVAMARGVGLPAVLMAVSVEPEVDRDGALVIVNRHVVAAVRSTGNRAAIVDFQASSSIPWVSRAVVDDVLASAMVHNNLGGAELRAGRLEAALGHLGIATRLAPGWSAGWVNLGVVRSRVGDLEGAFDAYRTALEAEPGNPSALNNLSVLYLGQGLHEEARVALRAAAETTASPYTLIASADSELQAGDLRAAARILRRARRGFPDEPEVWDALARLADRRGDASRAAVWRERAAALRQAPRSDGSH
ncbi:MAG: tetratricopeptide repeat protein [Thermoanaerobaculales bacterium]|jgi:Flp pilus assembly protein TadD|nr:tetratricopeptide repeat protein [Thermoanaerobaculales bacterium]